MMTLTFAFWMLVILTAIIGAMRGWAKELLVTFSVVLALFIIEVSIRYVPPIRAFFSPPTMRRSSGCRRSSWSCWLSSDTNRRTLPSLPASVSHANVYQMLCSDFFRRIKWFFDLWIDMVLYDRIGISIPRLHYQTA